METNDKPIANPLVVLREEFDDWAILFDPDTGNAFGLNPTGVYLWKLLDGEHSVEDMVSGLRRDAEDVPDEAKEHVGEFIADLIKAGLVGNEVQT
jgi:SynChlorMet cassette protein ScmD